MNVSPMTSACVLSSLGLLTLWGCAGPMPPPAVIAANAPPIRTAPAGALQLPLQTAWFEGRVVHYVTTDASDAAVAKAKGVNFVPRLKDLLPAAAGSGQRGPGHLERVYSFVNVQQPTIFPSVPRPVGPGSSDVAYTPLWRMVQVRWQPGRTQQELKSEEVLLAAADRGDVVLTVTDIVLNCPIIGIVGEGYLGGALPPAAPSR